MFLACVFLIASFAALGGGEAAAKEHDPSKRMGKATEAFKKEGKQAAKSIAGYTGAAAITTAALGKAVSGAIFRTALPVYGTYLAAKHLTIPKLKELGTQIGELKYAKNAARLDKKASEKKYGTIEAATKTRHAKEAIKKTQAKNKSKDLLTG